MVRLTKIYTRTGDRGTTRLVGGQEVAKDGLRIEAYGTVDELNAVIGMVRVALEASASLDEPDRVSFGAWLADVQQRLFDLGSDLATRLEDRFEGQPIMTADHIEALEGRIDAWNAELEPLTSFVLPGGGAIGAPLHLARTVCRRAERCVVTLGGAEPIGEQVIPFLNRLSDALFVASRWVAKRGGESEALWEY
ncbi:MAG: cob(I)yrinic acid a,c-diamide adenosyltransferase [Myxococcota bacterium]|jgi:cob(I)alamin adenosyltransferase|nr:cob(I)yrinic acid a,c-diamide adenosyltransferase [Myxococcota bacterium]